ncbi:hypothetical protein Hanom_Chr09g00804761 [Helianthus anomalus]
MLLLIYRVTYTLNGVSFFLHFLRKHLRAWYDPVNPPKSNPTRHASSLTIKSFSDTSCCI